jgi:hypothetical protein
VTRWLDQRECEATQLPPQDPILLDQVRQLDGLKTPGSRCGSGSPATSGEADGIRLRAVASDADARGRAGLADRARIHRRSRWYRRPPHWRRPTQTRRPAVGADSGPFREVAALHELIAGIAEAHSLRDLRDQVAQIGVGHSIGVIGQGAFWLKNATNRPSPCANWLAPLRVPVTDQDGIHLTAVRRKGSRDLAHERLVRMRRRP